MTPGPRDIHGAKVLVCAADGPKLQNDRDAVHYVGKALKVDARVVVIPVECFEDDFFRLRTRIAGEIVQKFGQYGVRLAILGDISKYAAASTAFAAFVYEANRGKDIWFLADYAELERRLEQAKES